MKKLLKLFFIISIVQLFAGTTFIVREDGREVGKWEKADGKNGIEYMDNEKPPETSNPVAVPTADPSVPITKQTANKKEDVVPENSVAEWRVSGKLVDIITLKGLSGGKINFAFTTQKKAEDLLINQQQHLLQLQNACIFRLQNYIRENN